jgi:hypothetical protein
MLKERSPSMAPTKFIAVNLTPEARDTLRMESLRVSMEVGRKVSMADALLILAAVARKHPEEVTAEARRRAGINEAEDSES